MGKFYLPYDLLSPREKYEYAWHKYRLYKRRGWPFYEDNEHSIPFDMINLMRQTYIQKEGK